MFDAIKIIDIKRQLGNLAKFERKRRKLTQQELADLLSVSRITIQNLESGKNTTLDTLLKVLQHFDLLAALNQAIEGYLDEQQNVISLY